MSSSCAQLTPIAIKRLKSEEPLKESPNTSSGQQTPHRGDGIEITWTDKSKTVFAAKFLRENCPCASCLEKRGDTSHAKPLTPTSRLSLKVIEADLLTETNLQEVWPVGNYAIGMRWADKHDSGIYSYTFLRSLDLIQNPPKEHSSCGGHGKCHNQHNGEHSGHQCKHDGSCSREGKPSPDGCNNSDHSHSHEKCKH